MKKNRILIKHFIIILIIALYILFYGKCLFKELFNIPCPLCGITRAYKSLLELDIRQAFNYHPLFWFIPLLIFFAFHNKLFKINPKIYNIIIISGSVIIFVTYIIRLNNIIII